MKIKKKKMTSGYLFENQIRILFESSGWEVDSQVDVGVRLGKKSKFKVDLVAGNDSDAILISCKYQDSQGTAIDKIPYEYMSLLHAVEKNNMSCAFIVTFGKVLHDNYFLNDGLKELQGYMRVSEKIRVVSFSSLQEMVLTGSLPIQPARQLSFESTL